MRDCRCGQICSGTGQREVGVEQAECSTVATGSIVAWLRTHQVLSVLGALVQATSVYGGAAAAFVGSGSDLRSALLLGGRYRVGVHRRSPPLAVMRALRMLVEFESEVGMEGLTGSVGQPADRYTETKRCTA